MKKKMMHTAQRDDFQEIKLFSVGVILNTPFLCRVKLSEAHMYPEVYRYLDDSIIQIITISDDVRLNEAQEYLKRVRTRNLYPIVGMSSRGFEVSY